MHITLKNKQGKGSIKNVFWIIMKSYWGNETQNTHFILIYVIQVRLSETSTAISIFFFHSVVVYLTDIHAKTGNMPKPLTVWITINCGKF